MVLDIRRLGESCALGFAPKIMSEEAIKRTAHELINELKLTNI